MRKFLTGVFVLAILLGQACIGAAEARTPAAALQARLQAIVDRYDPATTTFSDVETALGIKLGRYGSAHCATGGCMIWAYGDTRDNDYSIEVIGHSTDFKDFDHSWTASGVVIVVKLVGEDKHRCFAQPDWSAHLSDTGWEPTLPFTYDTTAWEVGKISDMPVLRHKGFVTRHGGAYLTMDGPTGSELGKGGIDALQQRQDCMTMVTIGTSPIDYRRSRGTLNVLDADTQAEFDTFQAHLEGLATAFNIGTEFNDIDAAIGPVEGGIDQPCSRICTRQFDGAGGVLAPFSLLLYQMTTNVDATSPDPFTGWKGEHAFLDVSLDDDAAAGLCFSQDSWNDTLQKAGWEPLKSFATTRQVYGSLDIKKGDHFPSPDIDVAVNGYATRRGNIYLVLASAGNSAQFQRSSHEPADFDRVKALDTCLRAVTVGDSVPLQDDYNRANGLPPVPHP